MLIGASHGGIQALSKLVSLLPRDFSASIFIVQHISPKFPSHLAQILGRKWVLPTIIPDDGEKIKAGTIYVAPADRHLLVKEEYLKVS